MFNSTEDSSHPGWQENEEVLLRYGNCAFKECKCSGCVVDKQEHVEHVEHVDDKNNVNDNDTASEPEQKRLIMDNSHCDTHFI
jgi:hypothetical protein